VGIEAALGAGAWVGVTGHTEPWQLGRCSGCGLERGGRGDLF
jgi:hypothetical protein